MTSPHVEASDIAQTTFGQLADRYLDARGSTALEILSQSLILFSTPHTADASQMLASLKLWGDMCRSRGLYRDAGHAYTKMAQIAHKQGDRRHTLWALAATHASRVLVADPDTDDSYKPSETLLEALSLIPEANLSPHHTAELYLLAANTFVSLGDLDQAGYYTDCAAASLDYADTYRIDIALTRLRILAAQNQWGAIVLRCEELLEQAETYPDPLDAQLSLHSFLAHANRELGDLYTSIEHCLSIIHLARANHLDLASVTASVDALISLQALGRHEELVSLAKVSLEDATNMHLSADVTILFHKALAVSLVSLGRTSEACDHAELAGEWARSKGDTEQAIEFLSMAAQCAESDQLFIRAAGLYGLLADLATERPLQRAQFLRRYARQIVYSSANDRKSAVDWATSIMSEAGKILRDLPQDEEVRAEIEAWKYDRLWIRIRRP
ncbi:MAG: hypothetical protein Q4G30_04015 [Actinomycetaceae bacterium]|nr:hypothetical protein [Actinomycetaceae bacterium]